MKSKHCLSEARILLQKLQLPDTFCFPLSKILWPVHNLFSHILLSRHDSRFALLAFITCLSSTLANSPVPSALRGLAAGVCQAPAAWSSWLGKGRAGTTGWQKPLPCLSSCFLSVWESLSSWGAPTCPAGPGAALRGQPRAMARQGGEGPAEPRWCWGKGERCGEPGRGDRMRYLAGRVNGVIQIFFSVPENNYNSQSTKRDRGEGPAVQRRSDSSAFRSARAPVMGVVGRHTVRQSFRLFTI